jgi:hypothetical protein
MMPCSRHAWCMLMFPIWTQTTHKYLTWMARFPIVKLCLCHTIPQWPMLNFSWRFLISIDSFIKYSSFFLYNELRSTKKNPTSKALCLKFCFFSYLVLNINEICICTNYMRKQGRKVLPRSQGKIKQESMLPSTTGHSLNFCPHKYLNLNSSSSYIWTSMTRFLQWGNKRNKRNPVNWQHHRIS